MNRAYLMTFVLLCAFACMGLLAWGQGAVTTSPADGNLTSNPAVADPLENLKLFCTVLPVENSSPPETRILAFLVNEADCAIPIYVLGFFGPEIWKNAKEHIEPLTVTERTSAPEHAPENVIVLRPHSVFGRQYVMRGSPKQVTDSHKLSCHYIVYENGAEGKADSIRGVIYPDRVDKAKAERLGR